MDKLKILALRLKELRDSLGLNQSEFSESIHLKQQTYSLYERGRNKPPIDLLIKIAEKYSVSLDWLCGLSDDEGRSKLFFDTYADILSVMFEMGFLDDFCTDIDCEKTIGRDSNIQDGFVMFYFNDEKMNEALKDWKKMHDFLQDGFIDEEVYSLWIEKTLKKYTDKSYR